MSWKVFLLSFLLVAGCQEISSNNQALVYERVVDGDTFIASGKRIRLWGIDAPEKGEPESYAASMYLEVLLEQGNLTCSFKHKDRYDRDVMQCFSNGYDVASDLVKQGMATDYKKYSNGYYSNQEKEAKSKSLGIWSGSRI
jgi:endonuclease YncB( thermonuclease family)